MATIQEWIEEQPLSVTQYVAFLLIFLVAALDGLDTQIISYVGRPLALEFHVSMAVLGSVFSTGLVGVMLGSLTLGTLGDVTGAKRVLLGVTALVGVATMATGFATSVAALLPLRFLTGFAVGGSLPNTITLISQFSPTRLRATVITLIGSSFPLGAALGGGIASYCLARHGWRSALIVAGILPLFLMPLLIALLPESFPSLLKRRAGQELAKRQLTRFYPEAAAVAGELTWSAVPSRKEFPLAALFRGKWAAFSILVPIAFFMSLLDVYLLSNWLPTLMQNSHRSLHESVIVTTWFNVAGMIASPILGRFVDRAGWLPVLVTSYLSAAACIVLLASLTFSYLALAIMAFLVGFSLIGSQAVLNGLPSFLYPDEARGAATGWGMGVGRLGSIAGPLIAGVLLTMHWTSVQVIRSGAAPAILAVVVLIAVSRLEKKGGGGEAPLVADSALAASGDSIR